MMLNVNDDDDDVQWFNVHLKAMTGSQLSLAVAHNAKVKTDMPEKNEKHLSPWSQSGG